MRKRLFVFLGYGIAQQATGQRPGARHALLLYGCGAQINEARQAAVASAEGNGWLAVTVNREKEMNADTLEITDQGLRLAATAALRDGGATVVYGDEMPLDG